MRTNWIFLFVLHGIRSFFGRLVHKLLAVTCCSPFCCGVLSGTALYNDTGFISSGLNGVFCRPEVSALYKKRFRIDHETVRGWQYHPLAARVKWPLYEPYVLVLVTHFGNWFYSILTEMMATDAQQIIVYAAESQILDIWCDLDRPDDRPVWSPVRLG